MIINKIYELVKERIIELSQDYNVYKNRDSTYVHHMANAKNSLVLNIQWAFNIKHNIPLEADKARRIAEELIKKEPESVKQLF